MDDRWRQLHRDFEQDPTMMTRIIREAIRYSIFSGDYLHYLQLLKSPHVPGKIISTQQRIIKAWNSLIPHNSFVVYQRGLQLLLNVTNTILEDMKLGLTHRNMLQQQIAILQQLQQYGPDNPPGPDILRALRAQHTASGVYLRDDDADEAEVLMSYLTCEVYHFICMFESEDYCSECGEETTQEEVLGVLPGAFVLDEYMTIQVTGKGISSTSVRKRMMRALLKYLLDTEVQLWARFHHQFIPGQIWN